MFNNQLFTLATLLTAASALASDPEFRERPLDQLKPDRVTISVSSDIQFRSATADGSGRLEAVVFQKGTQVAILKGANLNEVEYRDGKKFDLNQPYCIATVSSPIPGLKYASFLRGQKVGVLQVGVSTEESRAGLRKRKSSEVLVSAAGKLDDVAALSDPEKFSAKVLSKTDMAQSLRIVCKNFPEKPKLGDLIDVLGRETFELEAGTYDFNFGSKNAAAATRVDSISSVDNALADQRHPAGNTGLQKTLTPAPAVSGSAVDRAAPMGVRSAR